MNMNETIALETKKRQLDLCTLRVKALEDELIELNLLDLPSFLDYARQSLCSPRWSQEIGVELDVNLPNDERLKCSNTAFTIFNAYKNMETNVYDCRM